MTQIRSYMLLHVNSMNAHMLTELWSYLRAAERIKKTHVTSTHHVHGERHALFLCFMLEEEGMKSLRPTRQSTFVHLTAGGWVKAQNVSFCARNYVSFVWRRRVKFSDSMAPYVQDIISCVKIIRRQLWMRSKCWLALSCMIVVHCCETLAL